MKDLIKPNPLIRKNIDFDPWIGRLLQVLTDIVWYLVRLVLKSCKSLTILEPFPGENELCNPWGFSQDLVPVPWIWLLRICYQLYPRKVWKHKRLTSQAISDKQGGVVARRRNFKTFSLWKHIKCFPSNLKRKASVFISLWFEERFWKASFSWSISVDGRPN